VRGQLLAQGVAVKLLAESSEDGEWKGSAAKFEAEIFKERSGGLITG
jgi:hypothetical protein